MFSSKFSAADIAHVVSLVRDMAEDRHVPNHRRLAMIVRELAENVLYHSGESGGVCRAGMITDNEFGIEVRDRGIGIHASMLQQYPDIDEATALLAAFGGNVSSMSDQEPDRGLGLTIVRDYTETGAGLLLESGNMAYAACGGSGRLLSTRPRYVQGVRAALTIPLSGGTVAHA